MTAISHTTNLIFSFIRVIYIFILLYIIFYINIRIYIYISAEKCVVILMSCA